MAIEDNVNKYWDQICRCIQEPTVISHLTTILSTGDSRRIRQSFLTNHQEQGVQEMMTAVANSRAPGKWTTFLTAIREAEYPYLADLLESKHSHKHGVYEQKMIQIFSPELERGIQVNDIIADLLAESIITNIDQQQIRAMYDNKGNTYATIFLLDRMQSHCSPKKWYRTFLRILRKRGYKELAAQMEPTMLPSASPLASAQDFSPSEPEHYEYDESGACGSLNELILTDKCVSRENNRGNPDAPCSVIYLRSTSSSAPAIPPYKKSSPQTSKVRGTRPPGRPTSAAALKSAPPKVSAGPSGSSLNHTEVVANGISPSASGNAGRTSSAARRSSSKPSPAEKRAEQEQKPEFKGTTKFYLKDKMIFAEIRRSEDCTSQLDVRIWNYGRPTNHGASLSKSEWQTFVGITRDIDRALANKTDYEHRLGDSVVCTAIGRVSEVKLQKCSSDLSGSGKGGVRLSETAYCTLKELRRAIEKAWQ